MCAPPATAIKSLQAMQQARAPSQSATSAEVGSGHLSPNTLPWLAQAAQAAASAVPDAQTSSTAALVAYVLQAGRGRVRVSLR